MKPLTALSKICLILLSCIGLAACERQQLTVSGHLEDCNENYLFLDEITPDGINILDTILIMGGDFKYPIKKKEESLYRLRLNDTNFISFMGKRGDKVEISGNAQDLAHTYQISGNEASKVLREVSQRVDIMYQITDSLSKLFQQAQTNGYSDSIIRTLDSCYNTHFQSCKSYLQQTIENHFGQLVTLPLFYQKVGWRRFFTEENDHALWVEMIRHLQETQPESPHVKALQQYLEP